MTAGWVAASTRGSLLVGNLLGRDGARTVATAPTWKEARDVLAASVYGADVAMGADRDSCRHVAMVATAWQLRVLAGWLPAGRHALARLFAAPLEIANIEGRLETQERGREQTTAIPLGSLAVAWSDVERASDADAVRRALRASVWGDPGGSSRPDIALGLRVAAARRLRRGVKPADGPARAAVGVLVARELFAFGRPVNPVTRRHVDEMLGRRWHDASSPDEMAERLPEDLRWPFADVSEAAELWRAEVAVARRVEADATTIARSRSSDAATVAASMALCLVDLRRTLAAIDTAGLGHAGEAVFDAVA